MKKISLMIVFAFSILTAGFAQSWIVSVGAGYCATEAINHGFATGAYVGYRPVQSFELGVSFNHGIAQSAGRRHALGQHISDRGTTVQMTQESADTKTEHNYGNNSIFALAVGFSPIKLFVEDSRHDVLISAIGGLSYASDTRLVNNKGGMVIDTRAKGPWAYGARAAYGYRLTETVGIGISGLYDFGSSAFISLASLNVHF